MDTDTGQDDLSLLRCTSVEARHLEKRRAWNGKRTWDLIFGQCTVDGVGDDEIPKILQLKRGKEGVAVKQR
ncbi:hypothetical protein RJT34_09945 [Clitoria ternatea]|uniref:Uncharacterized protein n=1 Tax=Clitoria ternatea TaxID=43366 RepID=A0AAN9K9G0_CLITE